MGEMKYMDQFEYPMPVFSQWEQVSPDFGCKLYVFRSFHLIGNKGTSDSSTILPTQKHAQEEKEFVCNGLRVYGSEMGEGWRREWLANGYNTEQERGQCCLQIHIPICALEHGLGEHWPDECRERCVLIEVISLRWVSPSHESKPVSKELKMEWSLLYVFPCNTVTLEGSSERDH